MKLLYFILIALICALAHAQDGDSFEITFYKQANYKHQNGVIAGSVAPGGSAGSRRGNLTVASFKAPTWLQVTIFEDIDFGGASHVYKGPQKKISPPVTLRSVKWKHL
ncbi:hypothetical protein V8B55DRAFT_1448224 [Mucor lusitanicus]|uniref:Uncharacterized protein n=2 Tax=Mucor circinelloides f. lusitanicus TaxID=29924 RepID=A0A168GRN5_MUCCL|nr:hypothetical protein FB192DRAFT_1341779 [Mucor lusitanicus]OAC97959.1 hypothetical protein MUCCIDRAFT_191377 [Mucor lusitanicus CBS 277.49]